MSQNELSTPQLDSDLLRIFIAVARHGSVTRAAGTLHRTQSAVSVQIKRLEGLLETRLFERQARGVALTGAGEALLGSAHEIVDQLDRTAASFVGHRMSGGVRVGIPDEYGSDVLPGVLAAFAARNPDVEVSVQCGFSVGFPDLVGRGDLDLAIFASDRPSRDGEMLCEEQTVWVARAGFRVPADEPLPLALFDRSCWWRDIATEALRSAGCDYRIIYSSESVAGVKAAIAAGLAVGVLARTSLEPSFRALGRDDGLPPLPKSHLVLLGDDRRKSPAVRAMAEAIRGGFVRTAT
ncbi:MAG: LysR family transcriptional regulator [Hyphomicrobiales bacterium]